MFLNRKMKKLLKKHEKYENIEKFETYENSLGVEKTEHYYSFRRRTKDTESQ